MAAKSSLGRLKGQQVCFNGKFEWGIQERLQAMAEAQGATVEKEVDARTTHLVLADVTAGKTIQKKVVSLNAKGAGIQVVSVDDFEKLAAATDDELIALLQGGKKNASLFNKAIGTEVYHHRTHQKRTIVGQKFDQVDLTGFVLGGFVFQDCSFVGAVLDQVLVGEATNCDFSQSQGESVRFESLVGCKLRDAKLKGMHANGSIQGADFTGAAIELAYFGGGHHYGRANRPLNLTGVIFRKAVLSESRFVDISFDTPDFRECTAEGAAFTGVLKSADFRGARLTGASFIQCKLGKANFSNASLERATLADADLADADLSSANLAGVNLNGAKLTNVDLANAKNYDPNTCLGGAVGPALKELDKINGNAKRIQFSFAVGPGMVGKQPADVVALDSASLQWGWGLILPSRFNQAHNLGRGKKLEMSDALFEAARMVGATPIRFETLDISTTKSPVNANELRGTIIAALAEAFGQEPPEEEKLAELTKAWRDQQREATAGERAEREKEKAAAEKQKEKEKKQIAKKIEKAVGKVTDIATFLKALELRADKAKLDKATKMLKAERFQLFNDVTDDFVTGVVKSQSDPDLVYACRINQKGEFSCCTQNLNVCGGLRGSACKHLLVLIIGLVKAGKLEPTVIDGWVARTHDVKPALDKEVMGEIFIRYKGAEAGEVDWRPTETLPEDYYSL